MPVEPALRQGGLQAGTSRRQHRTRPARHRQIALSLALLVTCGLLLRSIYTLRHVPLGYRTDHIIVANLSIPAFRFDHKDMTRDLYLPLLNRVERSTASRAPASSAPCRSAKHSTSKSASNQRTQDRRLYKSCHSRHAAGPGLPNGCRPLFQRRGHRNLTARHRGQPGLRHKWAPDKHDPASIIGTEARQPQRRMRP